MIAWLTMWMLLPQLQVIDLPDKNPFTSAADVLLGQRIFTGRCAGCHGPVGEGGKGANLAVPELPRATDDPSLYRVIRHGIADTEMPGTLLEPKEIGQVAAYVRTLGRISSAPVNGDAARGQQLFAGKGGCLQCHALGLEGGQMGPTLTGIGRRRGPGHLRAKLETPAADVPEYFRVVKLTTRQGQSVQGIRLNEDTWSVQLRDMSGKPQSYWKSDLTAFSSERRTLMPSFKGRFSEQEIDDLVAYLSSQRGDK